MTQRDRVRDGNAHTETVTHADRHRRRDTDTHRYTATQRHRDTQIHRYTQIQRHRDTETRQNLSTASTRSRLACSRGHRLQYTYMCIDRYRDCDTDR